MASQQQQSAEVVNNKPEVAKDESKAEAEEKERNTEIVKRAAAAFLDYRKALTTIISPELGVIDDLTVTWMARYVTEKGKEDQTPKKIGRMHVSLHTKTAPEPKTSRQVFNSFAIDSNISFEKDLHPQIEEQEEKKRKEEEAVVAAAEAEKKKVEPAGEKIQEIVSAAAAAL